jgi:hypothetical protein
MTCWFLKNFAGAVSSRPVNFQHAFMRSNSLGSAKPAGCASRTVTVRTNNSDNYATVDNAPNMIIFVSNLAVYSVRNAHPTS